MESVWASVEAGNRQVVLLGGEPGAGKTRLAAEVAGTLHDNDVTVLVGNSRLDAGAPYEPFREMLDHFFASASKGSLSWLLEGRLDQELRRLSSQVSSHITEMEQDADDRGDARRELFDAVALFLRRVAAHRPLVLVAEDLHWSHPSTIALFEHVVHRCPDIPMLVVGSFRTTPPDRSDELSARLADLHRLEGVRRFDLGGLDTEAIAEYISIRGGVPVESAKASAAILRDRTGGNPFFLREVWIDLEARGGVSALRSPQRVPASVGDTLARRLSGLGDELRQTIELAAILGDTFDLRALVAANDADSTQTMAAIDSATALGLIETVEGADNQCSFVHSLARQTVLDQMAPSRMTILHASAAEALEKIGTGPALVPRLASHYLAAQVLGYQEKSLRYATEAGRLAEQSLAYEDAADWFERASATPGVEVRTKAELLSSAAANHLRAGDFARARLLYDQLGTVTDPIIRLEAAMGYEDANWRPGLADSHAADLMTTAIEGSGLDEDDPLYIRALGSLGRALAFAGQTSRARQVGDRAIELARHSEHPSTVAHTLKTSLWHGLTPDLSEVQLARATELSVMCKQSGDAEGLGAAAYFRAMAAYMCGRAGDLEEASADCRRGAQSSGQLFFQYVTGCVSQGISFMKGDFEGAEHWAERTLDMGGAFGVDSTEGSFGVQMFMIKRETGGLEQVRHHLDGKEPFHGRWIPGLLALYTALSIEPGMRRTLRHLMNRDLSVHTAEAQWPMELVFMTEAALALSDHEALATLRPLLEQYRGQNMVAGQFVAVFGSADTYLAQVSAELGDDAGADQYFRTALEMSERMGSLVHTAETLAHQARFVASQGNRQRSGELSARARELAEPIGQVKVLGILDSLEAPKGPEGLTERELDVLRLLADGLTNREIGERLYISSNTAANHVRSILTKTGAANRTQAAIYASEHHLL